MLRIEGLDENIISKCVNFFCDQLGIAVPNLHIFVDATIKVCGAVHQNGPDDYMIVIKERPDEEAGHVLVTLAHELTHVKQFMLDNLGAVFTDKIPYAERWWEIEAYKMEYELVQLLLKKLESKELVL